MTPTQLARALRGLAPSLQRALLGALLAWQRTAGRVALARLEAAVASGDTRAVVRLVLGDAADVLVIQAPFPDAGLAFAAATPAAISAASRAEADVVRRAADAVREAYRLGAGVLPPRPPVVAATASASFPELTPPRVVFTPGLPEPAAAAVRYGGDALAYLRSEAIAGVRVAVQEGLAAGVNPRDVARGLRDVVGLGESQARWVANLRRELEAGDLQRALGRQLVNGNERRTLAAIARRRGTLTPQQIDRLVGVYADRWRAWHAETIARTMSLDLIRHGQLAAMRAAVRRGDYGTAAITKIWVTTVDGRERDAHRALNGSRQPLDGRWLDDGVARDVPGGWNCRCSVRLEARPVPRGTTD